MLSPGLLAAGDPTLATHLAVHGPLRPPAPDAVADLAAAHGLTGRGGAGFPVAVKLRAVAGAAHAGRRRAVVVGNGAEGEPAAHKDAVLLARAPHLVLDGLQLVAAATGADDAVLAVPGPVVAVLERHLAERADPVPVRLVAVPDRFLAGEESALVSVVDGGPPLPRSKRPPVRERGVAGRPSLVQNVETLARLALLARGDRRAAAGVLVTRHAAGLPVDVADVPLTARLDAVLPLATGVQAVLVGGYHGSWLTVGTAAGVTLEPAELAGVGAALGAGVLAALPEDRCGLVETARVVGHLAEQSAGRCGPCLNGLPRIAAALQALARPGPPHPGLLADLGRWCGLVVGRGACSHPDGSVRLVASALRVFEPELAVHASGCCRARPGTAPFLPLGSGA
ncbi:NADH-ubiquinone oxidoreductase-F iron-sulfur binding region domain-containing protein [Goekera deserti]|uniref:NADH-ubiquinone oxidoreductase-F iron-sulfur binding region domain-containing protein n=1 Tax=Goekera deserti TaxID=2497753 RepID=UPI00192EEEE5|nr:NADH-ubiquinone oxidoreductase-F iron-sulfur binding region domain-containing protein [Goekera deserti]